MHLGERTAIQVEALKVRAFHHGVALPNIFADGPWAFCCLLEDGKISKKYYPPSKIIDRGGGTIPRCWSGGCGHGGGCSKLLALVKTGLEPTDSSVKLVLM